MLICCAFFFAHNGVMNKCVSQKHGINSVKICWCRDGIGVETMSDYIAIYERNTRDRVLCVMAIKCSQWSAVQYMAWKWGELAYHPCHTAITLFLILALDGKRRFLGFCFGHLGCSKMAALCLILHRQL
jgi:hypothetical protein